MQLKKFVIKNNYVKVFLFGLITAFLLFLPFLIYDKGLFLYYGDFDVQQIPFYKLAHEAIRSGNVLWNWNTDLGANFVGSYSFYLLGSPFFWLTLPFPTAAVPYLMAPLLMLKFAITGVTGYAYISRFVKRKRTAVIGALCYAFCGFNLYNIFFNHFNEIVLLFPLMLVALEEFVINKRRGQFALVVAASALMNYYFFFGQVVFVVLYFLVRLSDRQFRLNIKEFLILALEAVIGLLMSAVLLLPGLLAIMGNPRTDDMLMGFDMLFYSNSQRYGLILSSLFLPPDIPARPNLFPASNAKWSSVSLFLPMLSTVGLFAFFRGVKKHWAKILLAICGIMSIIPILNSAFSAFNFNYYARWFYMPLLVMAMVSCIALERDKKHLRFGIILTACFVGAFSIIGILPKKKDGEIVFFNMPEYPDRFWAYIAIAAMGLMLLTILYSLTRKSRLFFNIAVSGVLTIALVSGIFMIFTGKLAGQGYDEVAVRALNGRDKLQLNDDSFYRIDTYGELDNLGMYWGIPTINAFHSVVPASIMEYYDSIGVERGVGSRPEPKVAGVRALTSVKYSFVSEDKESQDVPIGFSHYDTQNGYSIYKNDYFVPMGFSFDYFMTQSQFEAYGNDKKDRVLLKGLLLSDEDYQKYRELMPVIDDGELDATTVYEDRSYFNDCEALAKNAVQSFEYDNKGFTAKVNSPEKTLLFFSVPYDEGFTATVNQNEAEIVKAQNGFMAVLIPEGGSIVRFEYSTPGMFNGLMITLLAIAAYAAYMAMIHMLRRKNPQQYRNYKYNHLQSSEESLRIEARDAYINKNVKPRILPPDEK